MSFAETVLYGVAAILAFALLIVGRPRRLAIEGPSVESDDNYADYTLVAYVNDGVESQLYSALKGHAGRWSCNILVKPRLEDIIQVRDTVRGRLKATLRDRVKSRHLDFVLIDHRDRPVAAVEIGKIGRGQGHLAADRFTDGLAGSVGLPLYRIAPGLDPVQAAHDIFDDLQPLLRRVLEEA